MFVSHVYSHFVSGCLTVSCGLGKALTGTVRLLPCAVLSSGIRRGMVGSCRSRYSLHMVERGIRAKKKERGRKLGFAFSPAFCQASLFSCDPSAVQFLQQHLL